MKKINLFILGVLFVISCEDVLNISPTDQISDEFVWSSPENANLFLNDIYNSLNAGPMSSHWLGRPSEVSGDPLDNYSGNSIQGGLGAPSYTLYTDASYDASNRMFDDQWRDMYANIRKTNLFIMRVGESDFEGEIKNNMLAQARFLRAFFYKQLIDFYGGVPLITKPLDQNSGEEINYPRSSYEEVVSFLVDEMADAAMYLPATLPPSDVGRVTRGAALALKGSVELYAGRWSDAAATNVEIIQSGVYDLFDDYESLFWEENDNNTEVIFDIQFEPVVKGHAREGIWSVVKLGGAGGWGSICPTQNIVDEYEFIDGLTEVEGSDLFDPQNPYQNRDERFYASIVYDGSEFAGETVYTRLGIPNNVSQYNPTGSGNSSTRTGYYIRKFMDPKITSFAENRSLLTSGSNYIVYRYAEILLSYAEAQNEVSGPDQTVYDAVNQVRSRVGQPDLPSGLSQDEMRNRIWRERRIELAFEAKYFYDIRRWGIADEVFSEPQYGIRITEENGSLVYQKEPVQTITFDPSKHYLKPIPQYALDQNPALEQNPGW